jgi:3-isopropylmalate dehydrogenase
VHKTNVLVHAGKIWLRMVDEVSKKYPGVTHDYLHIDAATIHMVNSPDRFDVIVTDNLFGDIITDLAAAICGGIGLAASANLNPTGAFPSMFEPFLRRFWQRPSATPRQQPRLRMRLSKI